MNLQFFLIHSLKPSVEFKISLSQNEKYSSFSDYVIIKNMKFLVLCSLYILVTQTHQYLKVILSLLYSF